MAYGLEVYRPDGTLRLSLSDRLTRLISTVVVSLGPLEEAYVPTPTIYNSDWSVSVINGDGVSGFYEELARVPAGVYIRNMRNIPRSFTVFFIGL